MAESVGFGEEQPVSGDVPQIMNRIARNPDAVYFFRLEKLHVKGLHVRRISCFVSVKMVSNCHTYAWGPCCSGSIGSRGYRERHCYRVGGCPNYQFMRSLKWTPTPMRLQAISEELLQSYPVDDFKFEGPCVDCLQTHGNDPVTPETLSVHAGEREGRPRVADSLTTPIVQTATYWFKYAAG